MKRHATNSGNSISKRTAKPVDLFSQPKTILQLILGWLTLAEASPLVRSCKHMHNQHLMFQDKPILPNGWNLFDVLERVEYLVAHVKNGAGVCHIPIQQLQFVLLQDNGTINHICIHPTGISARADCQAEIKHWNANSLTFRSEGYNGSITHCIQAIGLAKAWRCRIQFLSFPFWGAIDKVVFISELNLFKLTGNRGLDDVDCIEYEQMQNIVHSFLMVESNLTPQQRVCLDKYENQANGTQLASNSKM